MVKMGIGIEAATSFSWVGGHPALDFVNTVSWRPSGLENERLTSYAALSAWSETANLIEPQDLPVLGRQDATARALADAVAVRRQLHDFFIALAREVTPSALELAALNGLIADTAARFRLTWEKNRFRWVWVGEVEEWPTRAVIRAAAELLLSPRIGLLRECANRECGWVFLDESRRSNRRWCTMTECGARAKSRRYYDRRVRAAKATKHL